MSLAAARGELATYAREAVTAAAAILGAEHSPLLVQVAAAGTAHAALTAGWTVVLAAALPRRPSLLAGAAAGLAIAALDLGVVGRRIPAVAALDPGPQILDHLAFGVVVALALRPGAAISGGQGTGRPA
jgi:hypothetical protein